MRRMVTQSIGELYPELAAQGELVYESPQAQAMESTLQQGQGISEPLLYAAIAAIGAEQIGSFAAESINAGVDFVGDGLEAYYKLARWALFGSKRSALDGLKAQLIPFAVRALYNTMTYQPRGSRKNLFQTDIDVFATADAAVDETLKVLEQAVVQSAANAVDRARKSVEREDVGRLPGDVVDRHARTASARFGRAIVRNVAFTAQEQIATSLGFTRKRWITVGDLRVRDLHRARHGSTAPIGKPFQTPSGLIRYPGDVLAPIHETANCRCSIEWL